MKAKLNGAAVASSPDRTVGVTGRLRAPGAAVHDLVAQSVIEGIAHRAAAQPDGLAKQLMLQRLATLQACQAAAQQAEAQATHHPRERTAPGAALADLSELIDRLGRTTHGPPRLDPSSRSGSAATAGTRPSLQPLKAVAAFKGTWSRLRAEQRLRQALAQVPAKAGPLNSSHVVHLALQTLHTLSPAYLDAFMAHVDTLMWLEQTSGMGEPASRVDATRRAAAKMGRRA